MSNRESRRPRTPLNKSNAVSNTLKTKEIADKLIPLMEKCGSLFSASAIEVQAPLELRSYRLFFTSASSSSNSVTASSRRASGSSAATVGVKKHPVDVSIAKRRTKTSASAECPLDIPLIDHVLASGEDVCRMTQEPVARVEKPCAVATPLNRSNAVSNVVVVDTEVYSNTGGQSSNEQNFRWTFCPATAAAPKSRPSSRSGSSAMAANTA